MKKEIEFKFQVMSKQDLKKIENLMEYHKKGTTKILYQKNFFFDTTKFILYNNNLSIRIRRQNNNFIATLKSRIKKKIFCSFEYNKKITINDAQNLLNDKVNILKYINSIEEKNKEKEKTKNYICKLIKENINKKNLNLIGFFLNKRISIPFNIKKKIQIRT